MKQLGISIYPEHSTLKKDMEYISLAAKYGFKRIFTCLLSVEGKTKEEITQEFKAVTDHAHSLDMEVIIDVAPFVYDNLGISYDDLSFFVQLGVDGIRLDEGFNGMRESLLSCNKEGFMIEVNASMGNGYINNIMTHHPDTDHFITCHNFYPQKYTGLSLEHFNKCNDDLKKHNLKVAAFVSSQNKNTYGPWPVNEGLCTLEMHRDLPIDVQARHLFATKQVDDVIIANCYATEDELKSLSLIRPGILSFKIDFEKELQQAEYDVIYNHEHFVRGDVSEYMIRSTMPRVTYQNVSIKPENTRHLKRGDVVVVNDEYDRYKGELHIVLKDMDNDGRKNVVGVIPQQEMILLDYIESWKPFMFIQ